MLNRRKLGAEMEKKVRDYLVAHNMQVLEMNYRCKQGEIDIIAQDGDCYVFIEVKYRKSTKYGSPEDAVSATKQKRISESALYYLYSHDINECTSVRFDVAAILDETLKYYKNAFQFLT